jgi:hypothetical protein
VTEQLAKLIADVKALRAEIEKCPEQYAHDAGFKASRALDFLYECRHSEKKSS